MQSDRDGRELLAVVDDVREQARDHVQVEREQRRRDEGGAHEVVDLRFWRVVGLVGGIGGRLRALAAVAAISSRNVLFYLRLTTSILSRR